MTKSDEIWNKRFFSNKSSILLVNMPIMPLVLATPYDLSFTVKSIEVSDFIEGATSNIRWTPSWTRKIDPFSSFCSLTPLRGYCTPGPYFWRLCAFSQKVKQLRTKCPMDLVRNVPRNSKSQFYFSRDHCCEVTVKNMRKSIFSMFWTINQ